MISLKADPFSKSRQVGNVFKDKIARFLGSKDSGKLKEQSASLIGKAFFMPADAKTLAGESPGKEVKVCKSSGVNSSDIFIKCFSLCIIQGSVGLLRILIDLAPSHEFIAPGSLQPGTESTDPCKSVKYSENIPQLLPNEKNRPFLDGS